MLSRLEKFIFDITAIDLYWHRLSSEVMKQHGLKGSHAIYFLCLKDHPEGISAVELGSLSGKDKADVSRDLKVLEKAGLVYRTGNAYRASITLSDHGLEITEQISKVAVEAVSAVGKDLSEEERTIFYSSLDKIRENMHELSTKGITSHGHQITR